MFCTSCATLNPDTATHCATCGAEFPRRLALHANHAHRTARRPTLHLSLTIMPLVMLLLAASAVGWRSWTEHSTRATSYANAESALLRGDYDAAIASFGGAGSYRDAEQRRQETIDFLEPYRLAYLDGFTALENRRYTDAITLLEPVVRVLPDYADGQALLSEARLRHDETRFRALDDAEARGDWLTVEALLRDLAIARPHDAALVERVVTFNREHAPIAYARDGALYLVGPDGHDERPLTNQVPASNPVWDVDRRRIAFTSPRTVDDLVNVRLYMINADGGGLTHLADWLEPGETPAWSPDGTRLAYVRWHGRDAFANQASATGEPADEPRPDLYIMHLPSGMEHNITTGATGNNRSPTWSPSGDQLAFLGSRTSVTPSDGIVHQRSRVFVLTVMSNEFTEVHPDTLPDAARLAWSPMDNRLLIHSYQPGTWYAQPTNQIHLLNLATDDLSAVTEGGQAVSAPVWSPDGERFAFVESANVIRIRWAGLGEAWITVPQELSGALTWSPDGSMLLAGAANPGQASALIPIDGITPGKRTDIILSFTGIGLMAGPPQWCGPQSPGAANFLGGRTARDEQ